MLTKCKFTVLTMSGALALAATAALAAGQMEEDVHAIGQTKITLSQAIDAAEKSAPGSRATHADFERNRQGQWTFAVEVVKAGEALDIAIDPVSGKILSVSHDREDHDRERD